MVSKTVAHRLKLATIARYLGIPWIMYNRSALLRIALEGFTAGEVLDVGCADGTYLSMLSSYVSASLCVGIDLSSNELYLAKRNINTPKCNIILADAQALPFRASAFDLIFSKDLLHHLNDPIRALCEFKRALKYKGIIVILETRRENPLMKLYIKYGHDHFSLQKLINILDRAGLKGCTIKQASAYPHHFLFPPSKLFEIFWDLIILVLLLLSHVSIVRYSLFRLLQRSISPSYNVVIWRKNKTDID